MSVPSALSGPSFPHKRRNKGILPPYPNSVPSPHLQVNLPLNAWFQQSHGAKEQGRLILWPSCLTKQTLYFSWERKKSSRHLGKQTLRETHTRGHTHTHTQTLENLSNCYLILKYNYFKYIEQSLLSSIPEVPSFKTKNYCHTSYLRKEYCPRDHLPSRAPFLTVQR